MAVFEEIYMEYSAVQSFMDDAQSTMKVVEDIILAANDTVQFIEENSEGELVEALDGMWESLKGFIDNLLKFFKVILEALAYAIEQHQQRDKEGSQQLKEATGGSY